MQRYFARLNKDHVILDEGDVHHVLNVMRFKKGDEIEAVCDSKLYSCLIESTSPLSIKVNYEIPQNSELDKELTLFFALAKGDKIEFVIQKATELGVKRIVLVKTERCVVKFDQKTFESKLVRFNKIAKEASEQSHRIKELIVSKTISFEELLEVAKDYDACLYASTIEEATSPNLKQVLKRENLKKIIVLIGPEGGIDETEIKCLQDWIPVSLGPRILRTEVAPLYLLCAISYERELGE